MAASADRSENRFAGGALGTQALRQLGEPRIGANHGAGTVHGRDRHRGVIEEAHEADFGGTLRIGTLVARAADHQGPRGAGHAVGAECQLVIETHRHGLAAAHPQVDVEHLGLDFARHRHDRCQQRGPVAGHDVGQLQPARADFGKIVIEPVGQRGVDIDQVAGGIDREEPARRMIEIFDGVLQFLEYVLLPLAVAGDVGDRPHREPRLALALAQRPDPHPQPAAVQAVAAGDADFLLLPLALARRLEQAKYRLRHIGIADEHPLHRADVERGRRSRERQVGGVGIDHMAAGIGDREAVIGVVGDQPHHRIVRRAIGEANDSGGEGEQVEQPDHGQERQQTQDIRLRLRPADGHQRDCRRDDAAGHQQHQDDAAAAPRRFVADDRLRRRISVRFGGHSRGRGLWSGR